MVERLAQVEEPVVQGYPAATAKIRASFVAARQAASRLQDSGQLGGTGGKGGSQGGIGNLLATWL